MQQLIFEIENNDDANLLIAIAKRIGIKRYETTKKIKEKPAGFNMERAFETKENTIESKPTSSFIQADDSIDISGLNEIFTGKELDANNLRKVLWQRKK